MASGVIESKGFPALEQITEGVYGCVRNQIAMLYVRANIFPTATGWFNIATLPNKYKPIARISTVVYDNNVSSQSNLALVAQITADGVLQMYAYEAHSYFVVGIITYITAS